MTNGMDMLPSTCSCRGDNGNDLIALLVAVGILVIAHLASKTLTKWKGTKIMKNVKSIVIVVILVAAVGVVLALKQRQAKLVATSVKPVAPAATVAENPVVLPRLVDLGATKCIPCKMMAPILEELKKTYAGQLRVDFIDVWENPGAGKEYGINLIPTQIFYDAQGKERFRHEGFFAKEDILAKWKELGVTLTETGGAAP